MQKKQARRIKKILLIGFIIYAAIGVSLYFLQNKFLFHPKKLPASYEFSFNQPFEEINLPINAERNLSIIRFTVPDSLRRGIVLYFHGNRRNCERYAEYAAAFTRNHYEVWMPDYPGYGKTTGERSEEVMYADAATVYKLARSRIARDSIVIYGKSLGTGPAAWLASEKDSRRLILETPYYSIDALFRHYAFMYPVSRMTHYHFPVHRYLQSVEVPVTIFHGTDDEVIPYRQAKKLVKEAPAQRSAQWELVTLENGRHNNLAEFPLYQHKLDSLLSR